MNGRKLIFLPLLLLPLWIALYWFLQPAADFVVGSLFGMGKEAPLTEAIRFFLFETPKVLMLLVLVVFAVGIVRTFFTPERTRAILGKHSHVTGNVLASLLGIVTPFCSCSAVPLFIGFVEVGVPLGVTFSFLIAAPMINEVAVVLLFGLFGLKTAMIYVGTGLAIAMAAGYIIGRLHLENYVQSWVYELHSVSQQTDSCPSWEGRIRSGFEAIRDIVGKVWVYLVIGIAVGAGIHGWVPQDFMASIMGKSAWWSVPLAIAIGVPLYSNAAGIIPVVQALLEKGAALGTVLAFMMSVIGLSLPETIILRKVLRLPLIFTFVGIVAAGIMVVGYLFNYIF